MMKPVKIGVLGAYRGTSMINYCRIAKNAEVVAICDKNEEFLLRHKKAFGDHPIAWCVSFEEFMKQDMDAVVLANYANEHAPFAIRCLQEGKHVFSEVLPVQNMKEAVELTEAVERSGKVYAYGENYCYMPGPYKMRELYRAGVLGEFEYGECEYVHNCEPIWASITYGEPDHWRNLMYANFYCTHSIGPLIHMTGLRPRKVVGFEGTQIERNVRTGAKGGSFGIEMITLENGGIIKSLHGGLYKDSIWYSAYGSKGRMETAREDAGAGDISKLYVNCDEYSGQYRAGALTALNLEEEVSEAAKQFGHGGSDYYCIENFIRKIQGDEADIIDVYEALDMFLPGLFAYRSVLGGGIPTEIPDLREQSVRDRWRGDTMCADPKAAGEQLIPSFSKGNPEIPDSVYMQMRKKWETEFASENGYAAAALSQGEKK